MTTMTKSPSVSYSSAQIAAINDASSDKLDELLAYFGIDLSQTENRYNGPCPIHSGDKQNAFNIYKDGHSSIGNWKCRTRECHETFPSNVIGLIRGLLSKQECGWETSGDEEYPFVKTIQFLIEFTSSDISNIKTNIESVEKSKFAANMEYVYNRPKTQEGLLNLSREQVRSSIAIPSSYYEARGFSKEILDRYDIGLCTSPGKPMTNRNVVPIYSEDYKKIIACSGRSIFDKCPLCKAHHNPTFSCPNDDNKWKYSKWMHNKGFKSEEHLYNYWFAKSHILETKVVVLVESPGNVWKLEEAGIHNSVAMFGAKCNEMQLDTLHQSGAMSIVILMDPDQAGQQATQSITEMCKNAYQIYSYDSMSGDIADQTISYIKDNIQPIITQAEDDLR